MNPRASSTLKLMVAVALIASALGLLRDRVDDDWPLGEVIRDRVDYQWRLGELTLPATIALVGLASILVTSGRARRFSAGSTVVGVVVGLAFWVGPHSFREFVHYRVIYPLDSRLAARYPGTSMTELEATLIVWVIETPETRRIRPIRSPFWSHRSQEELGLLELAIAAAAGLLAAIPRPPLTRLTSPPMAADS